MGYVRDMATPDDSIRAHVENAVAADDVEARRMTERIADACWPGGALDRTEPAARHWLARWRPARFAVAVPVCSCAPGGGRCVICN
jgi:hypothetical protein